MTEAATRSDLSLLSWATSCTRTALFDQPAIHGLAFTGAGLFACGLKLRQDGWDMQHRIAQLASNPADVDTLRAWPPAVLPLGPGPTEADPQKDAAPGRPEKAATDSVYFPLPDDGLPNS